MTLQAPPIYELRRTQATPKQHNLKEQRRQGYNVGSHVTTLLALLALSPCQGDLQESGFQWMAQHCRRKRPFGIISWKVYGFQQQTIQHMTVRQLHSNASRRMRDRLLCAVMMELPYVESHGRSTTTYIIEELSNMRTTTHSLFEHQEPHAQPFTAGRNHPHVVHHIVVTLSW